MAVDASTHRLLPLQNALALHTQLLIDIAGRIRLAVRNIIQRLARTDRALHLLSQTMAKSHDVDVDHVVGASVAEEVRCTALHDDVGLAEVLVSEVLAFGTAVRGQAVTVIAAGAREGLLMGQPIHVRISSDCDSLFLSK